MRQATRSPRVKGGPDPTKCVSPQCFDLLVRKCVGCWHFRTAEPRPVEASSLTPRTPVQPQESLGTGIAAQAEPALPLPALLLGAPALLGLVLAVALVLVALVTWRRQRPRGPASPEAPDGEQDSPEPLENVLVLSSGCPNATAPVWPPPRENSATAPSAHSVPVPATELGSTELVTTKTAGPEQQ
ncbi:tumor necrosis factor receptor superfamily member 13C [Pteronotus mesoamericanus]|uniref:tumor necrosis factor receptor superfamily member 13C n=1 Tax=Pteronotus mesoamericanus TaxID=1884717 RepID=UPI0023EBD57A|nr:tumor necrosis factor receptor superfamily member 13C [Pteronotus parnellii mesoamericanus]